MESLARHSVKENMKVLLAESMETRDHHRKDHLLGHRDLEGSNHLLEEALEWETNLDQEGKTFLLALVRVELLV